MMYLHDTITKRENRSGQQKIRNKIKKKKLKHCLNASFAFLSSLKTPSGRFLTDLFNPLILPQRPFFFVGIRNQFLPDSCVVFGFGSKMTAVRCLSPNVDGFIGHTQLFGSCFIAFPFL